MSTPRPVTAGRQRPVNVAVLLRDAFTTLNDRVLRLLAESGHDAVRAAHGAIFQHLDDGGTTVSRLAERAQITKQAAAELVQHLEAHGYVVRRPDPSDRRAKLVLPTVKGREVVAIAQGAVPEIEGRLERELGAARLDQLRADLRRIIELG
ncbi:MarR family winged helix-turn-helix transcriptional regulator [Jiangella mangrovi]|uniref:DNA-binding MarR family transcriptional regulator n=1 Tax=Jiangella mangrovi TaxID=1524084 RepID=A0A7W9LJG9_9ACTN|nr:MarR family winged helix-turn-helix transcriptional regulator [Jiangella mangrovi]MBB5786100.1 DNA-binding MarR family transcriptional regulator [Jiangella mangrovi]